MSGHTRHTISRTTTTPFREAVLQMVDRARDLSGGKDMSLVEYKASWVGNFRETGDKQMSHTITFRIEDE